MLFLTTKEWPEQSFHFGVFTRTVLQFVHEEG